MASSSADASVSISRPFVSAPSDLLALLNEVSARETSLPGLPTGALLVERCHASQVTSAFREAMECAIGRRAAHLHCRLGPPQHIAGTGAQSGRHWLLLPLASTAAGLIPSLLADDAEQKSRQLARLMAQAGSQFFAGVRRAPKRPAEAQSDVRESAFPPAATTPLPDGKQFAFVELFAGIGGFRLGLEPLGGVCVYVSEIDEAARQTYSLNFGPLHCGRELRGQLIDEYAHSIPPFDLLTAGFPCQAFTERGEQLGFDDARGRLYLELVRVLTVCQPRAFLFENVPHLVVLEGGWRSIDGSSNEDAVAGAVLRTMLAAFESAGYTACWRLLNARRWVAQRRVRLYIVGFRADLPHAAGAFRWPSDEMPADGSFRPTTVRDCLEPAGSPDVERCTLSAEHWERIISDDFCAKSNRGERSREICLDGSAPTLIASYRKPLSITTKYIFEEADGTRPPLPRFLTKRECAALMGFPPGFLLPDPQEPPQAETSGGRAAPSANEPAPQNRSSVKRRVVGEREAYKQLGNSVCPPVIQAVAERMLEAMGIASRAEGPSKHSL